jgi:hypothetical protein
MANKSAVPFAPGIFAQHHEIHDLFGPMRPDPAAKTEIPLFFPLLPAD